MKGGSSLWIGGTLVAFAIVVAITAPWIALTDPVLAANLMNAEIPPGAEFPFGTDMQGRDIYSRIVYGARISLTVGIVSQICNSIIGVSLGLSNWSYSCRLARAQVLSLKSQGYVQAARILGYGDLRIMFTQLLPNILGPLIVIATLGMGGAILAEAALSFLGLGIRPPFPSWGSMLSEARDQIRAAPWLSVFPGLAIFFLSLIHISEAADERSSVDL